MISTLDTLWNPLASFKGISARTPSQISEAGSAHQYFLQSSLSVSNGEQAEKHDIRQLKVVPVWKRKIKTEWFNWDCSLKDCEFESF